MIIDFDDFLNESKYEVNKAYKEIIYDVFKNNGYGTFNISLKNDNLPLSDLKVHFIKNSWYSFVKSNKSYISNNILYDMNIYFNIPENDEYKIKEEILHELTHVAYFYNIVKNRLFDIEYYINNSIKITKDQDKTHFKIFRNAIYLSLTDELESREEQLYSYLLKFSTIREDILLSELKKSDIWISYEYLKKDNAISIYNYLIKMIGYDLTIKLVNELNKNIITNCVKYNIKLSNYGFIESPIKTQEELQKYFEKWFSIIKSKLETHKNNLLKVIDDVILDNRPIMETLSYNPSKRNIKHYYNYLKKIK